MGGVTSEEAHFIPCCAAADEGAGAGGTVCGLARVAVAGGGTDGSEGYDGGNGNVVLNADLNPRRRDWNGNGAGTRANEIPAHRGKGYARAVSGGGERELAGGYRS